MSSVAVDRSRAPEPGPLRPFQFPPIERFTLSNGMPVFFCRTGALPVATYSLLLPAGAVGEEPSKAGLATLTGSLLESGTGRYDAAEIAEQIETLGARIHVGTSWEVVSVDFTALSERTDAAARLAAHLVTEAAFPDGEVERIRREQLAGIMQRRAEPRGLANEMSARFIFTPESPFSRPLVGTAATVESLTRDDTVDFHRSTYTPRNAALIVAGNLPQERVRDTAEASFGGWTGPDPARRATLAAPRAETLQVVVVERAGAVQSEIRIGHVGVARNTPDFFPILVMNTILGGAFSSRLNLNLREKHGFTYGVTSSFSMRRHPGPFLVSTAVQTEVTGAAVREILAELRRIRQEPVLAGEIDDARQYVAGTFPLRLQTSDGVASRLAELFVYDLPESYLDEFAERILAVGEEEVLRAARDHIHPDRLMILVVGDPEKVRPQLEALDLGAIELVPHQIEG